MTEPQSETSREVEAALVVRADDPASILERIARLSSLDGQPLEHLPAQEIEDTYYDSPARLLGAERIALRLRKVDDTVLLTLKADSELRDGVSDRLELEAPWSRDALQAAQRALVERGIDLTGAFSDDAAGSLIALGLTPIQRRATHRTRRVAHSADGVALAEIALDTVTYSATPINLRLYEVEIERRAPAGDVGALADSLVTLFPSLHPWPYGKLSTGLTALDAVAAGRLELGVNGTLTPTALEVLERELVEAP